MKRAFTLVEALVSIAILGIIVTILIPAIYKSVNISEKSSSNLQDILYYQEIIEIYKSNHFNGGEDIDLNGQGYSIKETDKGELVLVDFTFNDGQGQVTSISLTLPKDTELY